MYDSASVKDSCLFVVILGLFVSRALAASAACQADWDWASNSKLQNPCEIAGALEAQCQGFAAYILGPIGQGANYVTPQKNSSAQKCECNTVMFSLYMACTACQNVSIQSWTGWSQYCDQVYVAAYPQAIPANTAVPNWAYLDYTKGDNFDPGAARTAGDTPERLAQTPTTVSVSGSTVISGSPTSIQTGPNSGSTGVGHQNNPEKKPAKVGIIVGGAIGGLAFFAAVGIGAWIFHRRQKTSGEDIGRDHPESPGHSGDVVVHGNGMRPTDIRLYNPSDPLTFPDKLDYGTSETYVTPSNKPHYTGAAEL